MELNVNDFVRVKLTDAGKEIAKDIKYLRFEEDGFLKIKMWDLMNIFGHHMYNGNRIPFEKNIVYIDETSEL